MKKQLVLLGAALLLVSGCGQTNDSSGTDFAEDVEFGKNDYQNIILSGNALGMAAMQEIEPNSKGNTFISPTSLYMALSMLYNGADGDTKSEIALVLNTELAPDEMNRANASLLAMLDKDTEEIQLNAANSIWLNERFHFQQEFAASNQDYFQAEVEEIDVAADESVDKVNDWVKNATADKIQDMVAAPLNTDLVAILLNAWYFKGVWQYEFDAKNTESKKFFAETGTSSEKQFMKMEAELDYLETDAFQAVALPYGEGEMSMTVILPAEGTSLDRFAGALTSEKWEGWKEEFSEQTVSIELPKFQLSYEIELNKALQNLGMATAFEKGANFSKMIEEDDPLWISLVKQKTFIEVDEKGTEAAAATEIDVITESAGPQPISMSVNRPFFIAISDEQTGAILFMGTIYDPEEAK